MNKIINPESTALQQSQDQWQKLFAFLLWKTYGTRTVTITMADIQAMLDSFEPGMACVFTHWHKDYLEFSLVTEERAQALAAHDAANKGQA
jgi:regulator of extracellular matrix RemA (YlzA/DUF370 family)